MFRLLSLAGMLTLLFASNVQAQNKWTLEQCINYGLENSLVIQQAEIAEENAEISVKSAIHQRFPNLSASSSLSYSVGRSIDPTTNDFNTTSFLSNGISLSSGIMLFNGYRINNSIKSAKKDKKASEEDTRQWQRDVAMNIASAYMAILFATENLDNVINQYNGTVEQLEKINKLISAGARPVSDRYDLEAQVALDEQNVVRMQNDLRKAYLDLKTLIRYEEKEELQIAFPAIEGIELSEPDAWDLEELYMKSLNHQPAVLAGEYREQSARLNKKVAESAYYPRLSVGGSINTNYSDQALTITNPNNPTLSYIPTTILFNNQEASVGLPSYSYDYAQIDYLTQIEDNIGFGAGLQLSIPIYSNYQNKANVSRSKLNLKSVQINNEQEKQQLKSNINLALANARAAKKQLSASRKSAEALDVAFNNATKRFELGQIGSYEYLDTKNKLDNAKTNLLIARYDFIFSIKVIEFYIGLPLKF